MAEVYVDFDVWKALTARRESEFQTYNDVLREMLDLPPSRVIRQPPLTAKMILESTGSLIGGRHLPDGTKLRSKYKGGEYEAEIRSGKLIGEGGKEFTSASAAARAVTKNNVNGLSFWEVRRPTDDGWRKLLAIPRIRP